MSRIIFLLFIKTISLEKVLMLNWISCKILIKKYLDI